MVGHMIEPWRSHAATRSACSRTRARASRWRASGGPGGTLALGGLDRRFLSGEDIELRWRLQQAGGRLGVSQRTIVTHRFEDSFAFAKGQFLADGPGLGRMVTKHGLRALPLLGLPLAASARGILL